MQTNAELTRASQHNAAGRPRSLHIAIIAAGYLIALFGAVSIFSVSLTISLLTTVAGCILLALASRHGYASPRLTWRTWLVWVVGTAMILGVLGLIGEDRVRHWTPHPAGYQLAWLICLCAFRHFRQICRHESAPTNAA